MFTEFPIILNAGILFLLLFAAGFIGVKVKIPNVIIYILLGIVVSGFFVDLKLLHVTGEIGIILLFFLLGLEFPIKRLAQIAKKIAPAGILDVVLNLGVVMAVCLLFGLDFLTSFIIGGITYATSSSITAKMLESNKRMANTESEFMLGILIFEDIVAPIVVAVLVALTAGTALGAFELSMVFTKIIIMTVVAILLGVFVFSKLADFFDSYINSDVMIMLLVGLALSYGGLALHLGLSEVLGAFLIGITLAEVKRPEPIEHLLLPMKDLLLPLFFLYFGTTIEFGEIPMLGLLITLVLYTIVAKVIVGIVGGKWYGLSKKLAFKAGLSLVSRGEFSVIIASLAVGSLALFGGIYILIIATIGIILFQLAPKLADKIYGKKKPKQKIAIPS
ncbi:sodium:proton exchanger [Anaerobacillus arseniciselenatis]|uniref:Sodium:proton exchanger n=1 Tax=Anaerobacillus arseniciselenatis TaxID=85682 RepID=A0A1S2LAJ1_9BACI|nr:cation:proton antiporter [Anaerobacillus arseniciselenatis]OIJ09366.1 sodium:proton exchanger [Anaerobacillus arseniciselenatis]